MFAPPVAKPKAKTAAPSQNTAIPLGHRYSDSDIGPESVSTEAGSRGFAWDFSKIPLFPSERTSGEFQSPSRFPALHLPGPIQAKLKVGAVDDPSEHEADLAADQVMRMPDPALSIVPGRTQLSRKCAACEEEEEEKKLQMKPAELAERAADEAPPIVHEVLRSPGQPLDAATRAFMEPRFGYDFSKVRVHTDTRAAESATAVQARGYTVGSNVVFGAGEYRPGTREGQRLLGHELAHVVQQANGGTEATARRKPQPAQTPAPDRPPLMPDESEQCAAPNSGYGVLPIEQFIHYVEVVEKENPSRSPEEILTQVRKLYYSNLAFDRLLPDSPGVGAVETCFDDEGRTCSGPVGVCVCSQSTENKPTSPQLEKAIRCLKLHADENASGDNPSPYVEVNGQWIDIGHVLLGVDALLHPQSEERPYGRYGVTAIMASGWEADVGITMVLLKEHQTNGRKSAEVVSDPSPTLEDYYQYSAPMTDILGDVDAFGIPFEKYGRLSHALRTYYLGERGQGPGTRHRWAVFAEMNNLRYTVSGGKVSWTKETRELVRKRLITFADLYALREDAVTAAYGKVQHQKWPDADKFVDRFLKDVGENLEKDLAPSPQKKSP
jgi:hypothetical protein